MMSNILKQGLENLSLPESDYPLLEEKLRLYMKELLLFNAAYDLVGADNEKDIIIHHLLDSLAGVHHIEKLFSEQQDTITPKIADIGSGGGLPGIPLALALPHIHFTLVERMSKRCAFLENSVAILNLKNVTVINSQVEQIPTNSLRVMLSDAAYQDARSGIEAVLNARSV